MSTTTEHPLSLDLVLSEVNEPLAVDPRKGELVAALTPLVPCIADSITRANELTVRNQQEAEIADNLLVLHRTNIKTVQTAIKSFKDEAKRRHSLFCDLEGLFVDAFTTAGKTIKAKRDEWTRAEAEKAEKERQRLQAIQDEIARKEREKQEAIARAAREKEDAARRAEEEARRAAAAEQDAAKRKELEAEAARKAKEAAAAAAKAAEREERAAAVTTTVVSVSAPQARKGARMQWKVKSFDMTAMGITQAIQGFVTVETTKLERMKAANTMFECAGVVFHQVTV